MRAMAIAALVVMTAATSGCAAFSYRVDRGALAEVAINSADKVYVEDFRSLDHVVPAAAPRR